MCLKKFFNYWYIFVRGSVSTAIDICPNVTKNLSIYGLDNSAEYFLFEKPINQEKDFYSNH